jgi:hypothetical protein
MRFLRHLFGDETLTREESLEQARQMLDRLHNAPLTRREPTDGGVCDDCKRTVTVRWTFGQVTVCRRCLLLRMAGAEALTRTPSTLDVSENSEVVEDAGRLAPHAADDESANPTGRRQEANW